MKFEYTVAVECASRAEADQVMEDRLRPDEDYGFLYTLGWEFHAESDPPTDQTSAAFVYLIEIEDEGDVSRYIFTDPEWAEWLRSNEPGIPAGEGAIVLTLDNIPASMATVIRDRGAFDFDDEDESGYLADLTIGSYPDDKIHFLTEIAEPLDSINELRRYEVVGQFATIAY